MNDIFDRNDDDKPMRTIVDAEALDYFSHEELACPATGKVVLHFDFADSLQLLREQYGKPIYLTSCCRSKAYNERIGGHPRSLHVYDDPHWTDGDIKATLAIDISLPEDEGHRHELAHLAGKLGFSIGINVASGFFHLDRRDLVGLPQTIFYYG